MKNKNVVQSKDYKAGKFTTITYSVLRDKNLSSNAKVLLIEILSDSDKFKFSETVYVNRMDIGKKAYYKAMDNLIENGYIRKSKIGKTNYNFYTISEFGNLKDNLEDPSSEAPTESIHAQQEKPIAEESTNQQSKTEIQEKVMDFLIPFSKYFNKEIGIEIHSMLDEGLDYYQIKFKLNKIIEKEKVAHFKSIKKIIEEATSMNPKTKIEAVNILKSEVFEKNNKTKYETIRLRASQNINQRKPIDAESAAEDRADNA